MFFRVNGSGRYEGLHARAETGQKAARISIVVAGTFSNSK